MSEFVLTLDGREVKATKGETVLDVARREGVDIPTLCHHKDLAGFGACRICMVEVGKEGSGKMVASCLYPAAEGIVVHSTSPRVVQHRKIILELIQARWPWVGPELKERYGAEADRFDDRTTFCILCGLCVRHCSEKKGANVLGFVGRGVKRQVAVYPHLAKKHCATCGDGEMECRQVCPTGVIPNDWSLGASFFGVEPPLAVPVRMRDIENDEEVCRMVGYR